MQFSAINCVYLTYSCEIVFFLKLYAIDCSYEDFFLIFAELTIQLMALAEIIKLVSHTFRCIFLFGMKFAIPMHNFWNDLLSKKFWHKSP